MQAEALKCFSLHKDTTPPQPNHTVTPTHIEPEQYNPWDKSTISRKLLKMNVVTLETCWALNTEIIKRVTSSWSIFIQLQDDARSNKHKNRSCLYEIRRKVCFRLKITEENGIISKVIGVYYVFMRVFKLWRCEHAYKSKQAWTSSAHAPEWTRRHYS